MTTEARSDIVLLYGRPGVGKFTVGRALAEHTGYRLLHNHAVVDLVAALFPFGSAPFIEMRERLWLDAVQAALAARLPGVIMTFAPERTVTDAFLPALERTVAAFAARLRLVELRCDAGTLERRLVDSDRAAFGKLRDLALYRALDEQGVFDRPVMPPPEISVDTSEHVPAEAASIIARELGAGAPGG